MLLEIRSSLLRYIAGALVVGLVIAIFISAPHAAGRYALERLWQRPMVGMWWPLVWIVGIGVIILSGYVLTIVLAIIIWMAQLSIGVGEVLFGRGEGEER